MSPFDAIPEALRRERRWLLWNLEERTTLAGVTKKTKVPYQPAAPGRLGSSTHPETWGTFDAAVAAVAQGRAMGIGFVLGDGFVGIDIDGCRNPETNARTEAAQNLIDTFATYTELSPSGTGVHLLLRGELAGDGVRNDKDKIEVYAEGRYFTMTGQQLGVHGELASRPTELAALVETLRVPVPPRKDGKPRVKRTPAPKPVLITRPFPSSRPGVPDHVTRINPATGRGTCTCEGWKYAQFGKPCRHMRELAAEVMTAAVA